MEHYIGKPCNCCGRVLTAADEVIVCPSCRKAHHVNCWIGMEGCSTPGCSEQAEKIRTARKQQISRMAPQVFYGRQHTPGAPYAPQEPQYGGQQPPYGAQQSPYSAQQHPYNYQQPPYGYGTNQPPYGGQQSPYGGQQPPYGAQQPPFGVHQSPYSAQQPPYNAQQPVYGSQPPASAPPYTAEQEPPRKKKKGWIVALILLVILAGSAAALYMNRSIFIYSVEIENPAETVILPGSDMMLKASVLPAFANQGNLEWSASNPEVAGVDQNGNLRAFRDGDCEITVRTRNGCSATCSVTVCSLAREWTYAGVYMEEEIYSVTSPLGRMVEAKFSVNGMTASFSSTVRSDDPITVSAEGPLVFSKIDGDNIHYTLNPTNVSLDRIPVFIMKSGHLVVALTKDLAVIFDPVSGGGSSVHQLNIR